MDYQTNPLLFEKQPIFKNKAPAVKWFKEWVPQEIAATGGKCCLLKWVTEDMLMALKEKYKDPEPEDREPEPTTEVLFLCSYEGCGKTFIDAGALKKHSHVHGERQYVCTYEGCGKKFLDSSKLKRHYLIHTGERSFLCPHEGCGKAFSLDFNLRAHMKTHSQENYHICPKEDCRKRFAHEYKLKAHMKTHHEKQNVMSDAMKYSPPERPHSSQKRPVYATPTSDRPYACPYEGCEKAYIHEYKLNLHLRREHPGHNSKENGKRMPARPLETDHEVDEASVRDVYADGKGSGSNKKLKRSKRKLSSNMMPPSQIQRRKGSNLVPLNLNPTKLSWASKTYEEDSEETEEDRDNAEDGWRYGDNNVDDETEYED